MLQTNVMIRAWLSPVLALLAMLGVLLMFHGTVADVVKVWNQSGTYTHGYFVLPIAFWLIWRERAEILQAGFRPGWLAIPAMLASAGLWLAGDLAGVSVVTHFGLAFMLMCCIWAAFGNAAARRAWFGIGFIVFSVPFGDFLLPIMMEHTADFTVWALRVSGVPVYREGLNFVIPSGHWSVVEACSGLRYLIASVMVGALFAFLNYSSRWRRILFFLVACIVPLVANWLRAYMIVMIGHFSGNTLAVGVDHLIYGWVFFGVVMFLLFWIGSWWRDDVLPKPYQASMIEAVAVAPFQRIGLSFAVLAIAAATLLLSDGLRRDMAGSVVLQAPAASAGWTDAENLYEWTPTYEGKRASLMRSYQRDGQVVSLYVAYYAGQDDGRELVQWANQAVLEGDRQAWRILTQGQSEIGQHGARTLQLSGRQALRVWSWYWLDGDITTSDSRAKLDLAIKRLSLRADDSAAVYLIVPDVAGAQTLAADFLRDHGAAIDAMLREARAR